MPKEFTILEKRVVASDKVGNEMAWFLRDYPDNEKSKWAFDE